MFKHGHGSTFACGADICYKMPLERRRRWWPRHRIGSMSLRKHPMGESALLARHSAWRRAPFDRFENRLPAERAHTHKQAPHSFVICCVTWCISAIRLVMADNRTCFDRPDWRTSSSQNNIKHIFHSPRFLFSTSGSRYKFDQIDQIVWDSSTALIVIWLTYHASVNYCFRLSWVNIQQLLEHVCSVNALKLKSTTCSNRAFPKANEDIQQCFSLD